MKLILDTLERARLAASPSDAMILADAIADMEALAAALEAHGLALDAAPDSITKFNALAEHAISSKNGIDESEDGYALSNAETFGEWVQKLWALAS